MDELRLQRLLRSVADDLSVLRTEQAASEERRTDPLWLRGIKYTFVTAIERCIDVAQHICSSEGWGPPADNGDAMRLLGEHGVIDRGLAASLRKAVGFRNVLVHEYVAVVDEMVVDRLHDLGGLGCFVSQVAAFLRNNAPEQTGRG